MIYKIEYIYRLKKKSLLSNKEIKSLFLAISSDTQETQDLFSL